MYICTSQPLANEDFDFVDFLLNPNPTNGNFTAKFLSDGSNPIGINIHDISGREVYSKTFFKLWSIPLTYKFNRYSIRSLFSIHIRWS